MPLGLERQAKSKLVKLAKRFWIPKCLEGGGVLELAGGWPAFPGAPYGAFRSGGARAPDERTKHSPSTTPKKSREAAELKPRTAELKPKIAEFKRETAELKLKTTELKLKLQRVVPNLCTTVAK